MRIFLYFFSSLQQEKEMVSECWPLSDDEADAGSIYDLPPSSHTVLTLDPNPTVQSKSCELFCFTPISAVIAK